MTKERPILFSAPMVRAILEGRKTQTRRIVKPQPPEGYDRACWFNAPTMGWTRDPEPSANWWTKNCPYGVPSDRLWVREAFYYDMLPWAKGGSLKEVPTFFSRTDFYYRAAGECCQQIPECCCCEVGTVRWRPAIHMPRWASRITLEVTGVRVERLQDISEADAVAEGAEPFVKGLCTESAHDYASATKYRDGYRRLWESINGPKARVGSRRAERIARSRRAQKKSEASSWDANPWVWVIEFKRLEAA